MPNGGTDNCGECVYGEQLGDRRVRCTIRHLDIGNPYWTYCANHPINNPDGIEVPAGPVYVIGDDYPYRRVPDQPSPDGLVAERLEVLRRAVRGELDPRTRKLQVGIIEDLAREGAVDAVPLLVELALAEPGNLEPVGFAGPDAPAFDLSYQWESDAVRVEFVRLAALRALRRIFNESPHANVIEVLSLHQDRENPDLVRRINFVVAYVLDYQEPP